MARCGTTLLLRLLLAACAGCAGTGARVAALASQELACRPEKLRVQPLGELQLREPALRLSVHHVEGCQRERTYYCNAGGCAAKLAALGIHGDARFAVARALHIRRTTSRARCPSGDERLVQLSASLYRFEACDGRQLVHCRRRGCEVIGRN